MNLERKSQAGNSATYIAAYVSACWIDSEKILPSSLAFSRWTKAGIRLEERRVIHKVPQPGLGGDFAPQRASTSGAPGTAYDAFKEDTLPKRRGAEDPDPRDWAESINALLKVAQGSRHECEAVSRAFLVISLVLVQAASREIQRLRVYMTKSLPNICVSV